MLYLDIIFKHRTLGTERFVLFEFAVFFSLLFCKPLFRCYDCRLWSIIVIFYLSFYRSLLWDGFFVTCRLFVWFVVNANRKYFFFLKKEFVFSPTPCLLLLGSFCRCHLRIGISLVAIVDDCSFRKSCSFDCLRSSESCFLDSFVLFFFLFLFPLSFSLSFD